MISVETDADGNPRSAIPIDAHASAYINTFWDELLAECAKKMPLPRLRSPNEVVPNYVKKQIFILAEKAYRLGVAREGTKYRETKASYDKMARLTGALIGAIFDVRRARTLEEAQHVASKVMEGDELPTIEQINEQRASFAYGQLALTSQYRDATPEKLEELKQTCLRIAGCK